MGWASWNHFFCDYNEQTIRDQADALVSSGMRDLGYRYVIIQECIALERDAGGNLIPEARRFPHGMPALASYIHARGLKAGIYTDVGKYTCYAKPKYQGSFGHEDQDAATFASWGMDLVEMDYCNRPEGHTGREIYERMSEAIRKTGRPMLFYLCSWGNERPWEWAKGVAQVWRTERDISYSKNAVDWNLIVKSFESNARHAVFNAPNGWNDPDMLEIGSSGLTDVEQQTHFNMWAISASPLWSGADLTRMDSVAREIYTNREAIAVDQDPLGEQATKVREDVSGLQVWSKHLGSKTSGLDAVLLVNLTSETAALNVSWADLGLVGAARVRDLWKHQDLGSFPDGYQAQVPPHGSVLLKVSGDFSWSKASVYEAEWPGNIRAGKAQLFLCGECGSGYGMVLHGGGAGEESSLRFTHIEVSQPARYKLEVAYVGNGVSDNTVQLQVNSDKPKDLLLPQYMYGVAETSIDLAKGSNTIAVKYSGKGVVSIDQLRLRR